MATAPENAHKLKPGLSKVTEEMVAALEEAIDRMIAAAPLPEYFVLPGGSQPSAALDVARSVVRRCERSAVALSKRGGLADDVVLRFLNRLSDLLFVAARYEEHSRGLQAPRSHD